MTGAKQAGEAAYKMAKLGPRDVDVVELYDAFTINTILFLEDLGFCRKGEGGTFVSGGNIAPGGELPVNTNGGGLSYCHPGMYGLLILIEGVRQLRGECGARQVAKHLIQDDRLHEVSAFLWRAGSNEVGIGGAAGQGEDRPPVGGGVRQDLHVAETVMNNATVQQLEIVGIRLYGNHAASIADDGSGEKGEHADVGAHVDSDITFVQVVTRGSPDIPADAGSVSMMMPVSPFGRSAVRFTTATMRESSRGGRALA